MKTIFNKVVSKDETRKEMSHVLVTNNRLVATNSYSLIEVRHEALKDEDKARLQIIIDRTDGTLLMKPEELDMKKEILETMPIESGADFPKYEAIMPSMHDLNSHYSVIDIDPRRLVDMLTSISKTFKNKEQRSVKLYIPKASHDGAFDKADNKVVIRRADGSVTGIVMPLN